MNIREKIFNYRSYTPIPILIAVLIFAEPTPATLTAGFVIALAGEALRIWAVKHAGGATRTTSGVGGSVLITHGPYALTRNPLYLGNFILSTGLVVMAWAWMPWMLLLFWGLFGFQYSMIISLEEKYLSKEFGEQYREYCKNIPRIFPRINSYSKHTVETMPVFKALRVEKNTLTSFTLVSLAIFIRWAI